jgi:terminase large subunit-like protein
VGAAADLAMALDRVVFAREALGLEPDGWQAGVLRWSGRRLLMNCCRQSGKSTTAAVLALHEVLYRPGCLVLLLSPSMRQSSELFRKVTNLLSRLEPRPTLTEDNRLSLTLQSGSRVVSLPSSEATVRGFSGASLIIEDEASRVPDELYRAIRPMLATSGGRLVLMSTPWGQRGHFHQEWADGGPLWERVRVSAYECPRISREFLEEERRSLGDLYFRSEYLCEFTETSGQLFTYDDVVAALDERVTPLFAGGG